MIPGSLDADAPENAGVRVQKGEKVGMHARCGTGRPASVPPARAGSRGSESSVSPLPSVPLIFRHQQRPMSKVLVVVYFSFCGAAREKASAPRLAGVRAR